MSPDGRPSRVRSRRPGRGGAAHPVPSAAALVAALAIPALLASAPAAGRAAEPLPPPIPWREPSPAARLFLQLPFESPQVLPAGTFAAGLQLLYSNSVLLGSDGALLLDVHVETAQPTVVLRRGLGHRIEAQVSVPFVVDYGGFLDRPIEVVEGWFGFTNPQRQGRPRNVARFHLARADGSGVWRDGAAAGLGDVWASLKANLAEDLAGHGSVAVRAALKLPTGRLPFGSEEVDAAASLSAAWAWSSTAVRMQLDLAIPTASLPRVHLATHAYGAAHLGVAQRLGHRVAVQLQASAHLSPLARTGLDQLDDATAYVLAGVSVALSPSASLDAAVVENVFSPYRGADVTFPLGFEARF